ncbi:MAG: PhzF family phenazine biosynthesis protein, partial [Bryobacteraceae bacterium]
MRIPLYQLDAFTDRLFAGNQAAVCVLEEWLPDQQLRSIAAENNLSETAFLRACDDGWELRWFTPEVEVDLCGHATLAAAHLILHGLQPGRDSVRFFTRSGELVVRRREHWLEMDFPARPPQPAQPPAGLVEALGRQPREIWKARDYMAVYETEEEVRDLRPDM